MQFILITITTHNRTLLVRLKVEPFEQWNPGPNFKTYQPQRAELAARNSGTNTAVFNFSRLQLTIRQIRRIQICCISIAYLIVMFWGVGFLDRGPKPVVPNRNP